MSTQKRARRFSRAARMCRLGEMRRRRQEPARGTNRAGSRGSVTPAPWARNAGAGGITAPYLSINWSSWFWMATNFLLEDSPIRLSVRLASEAERSGSPPVRDCRSAASGQPASPGHPAISFPTSHVSLHPALPQAPATRHGGHRAERYDGQRNLHFLHAA